MRFLNITVKLSDIKIKLSDIKVPLSDKLSEIKIMLSGINFIIPITMLKTIQLGNRILETNANTNNDIRNSILATAIR